MSEGWLPVVAVGLGFVVLLGTGYWLRRGGKPYGQAALAIHKLISVAVLVFILWDAFAANSTAPLSLIPWGVVSLAALSLVTLIGTGGALSAMASAPRIVRWMHRVVPYVSIALTAAWLLLR